MDIKFTNLWDNFIRLYNRKSVKSKVMKELYIYHINGDIKSFIRTVFNKWTYVLYQLDYTTEERNAIIEVCKKSSDKKAVFQKIHQSLRQQYKDSK